jgi:hypothetical protein
VPPSARSSRFSTLLSAIESVTDRASLDHLNEKLLCCRKGVDEEGALGMILLSRHISRRHPILREGRAREGGVRAERASSLITFARRERSAPLARSCETMAVE